MVMIFFSFFFQENPQIYSCSNSIFGGVTSILSFLLLEGRQFPLSKSQRVKVRKS